MKRRALRKRKLEEMKQILVIRKDLNMRKGKIAAQAAHASLKATLENLDDPRVKEWLSESFTKIAVSVDSEEEMRYIEELAKKAGLIVVDIVDNGKTEFNGVPTLTTLAIGPDTHENLFPITGNLKLL